MKLEELRSKHPRLIYRSYQVEKSGPSLVIRHELRLEPDIVFHPEVIIPAPNEGPDPKLLATLSFNLGLIEAISYWKAACPPELVVEADSLNQEQIVWWHDLFINGLGEFFYKNNIDFTQPNFLSIITGALGGSPFTRSVKVQTSPSPSSPGAKAVTELENARLPAPLSLGRDLVLVGGGKDSAVTLELLKKSGLEIRALVLNPTRAALENIKIAGYPPPLVVKRTIDPRLLELNKSGYLNGHTPFSAYLAFLGTLVAALHGYQNIIVSNEASANEGNVTFHGVEINHQYSKTYRFEKLFREYARKYLTDKHHYFSLLRPLNELEISKVFSQYPQYLSSFRSCNVGAKTDSWCGACAKCAFVYLSLFPFVSYEQMLAIFGGDLFTKPEIVAYIRQLVGLDRQKPFECVGTREEVKLAVSLGIKRYAALGKAVPQALLDIEKEMGSVDENVLSAWNNEYFIPEKYLKVIKKALEPLQHFAAMA